MGDVCFRKVREKIEDQGSQVVVHCSLRPEGFLPMQGRRVSIHLEACQHLPVPEIVRGFLKMKLAVAVRQIWNARAPRAAIARVRTQGGVSPRGSFPAQLSSKHQRSRDERSQVVFPAADIDSNKDRRASL